MAKDNGKKWRIYIVDGSNTAIPLETTSSFGIENAIIDASDKDSGGWAVGIDGQRSWTAESTLNYDQTETGQLDLIDKLIDTDNSTEVDVAIGLDGVVGDISWTGSALIASGNFSADNEALITLDISLTGNSALTKVTKV
jgi:predicted secreted protein